MAWSAKLSSSCRPRLAKPCKTHPMVSHPDSALSVSLSSETRLVSTFCILHTPLHHADIIATQALDSIENEQVCNSCFAAQVLKQSCSKLNTLPVVTSDCHHGMMTIQSQHLAGQSAWPDSALAGDIRPHQEIRTCFTSC